LQVIFAISKLCKLYPQISETSRLYSQFALKFISEVVLRNSIVIINSYYLHISAGASSCLSVFYICSLFSSGLTDFHPMYYPYFLRHFMFVDTVGDVFDNCLPGLSLPLLLPLPFHDSLPIHDSRSRISFRTKNLRLETQKP
jgi:hypothetical protein